MLEGTNLTLKEIIEREVQFINQNNIFDKDEYQHVFSGEIKAYKELLSDMCILEEKSFYEKYLGIAKAINEILSNEDTCGFQDSIKKEELMGYSGAINSVLVMIRPEYEYDL